METVKGSMVDLWLNEINPSLTPTVLTHVSDFIAMLVLRGHN